MWRIPIVVLSILLGAGNASADGARLLCSVVADTKGTILHQRGEHCGVRFTPASTFKVTLAAMGYDAGILKDGASPVMTFREGYPDWGRDWKKPTSPSTWMRNSVLWYSQEITKALGAERFAGYVTRFGYGNADVSGDASRDNGLERSWVSSSLKISPIEQTTFIARLVTGGLPISPEASARAVALVEPLETPAGILRGKTGSALPRDRDGNFDRARGFGWYVGWADVGGELVVFAHLRQDTQRGQGPGGLRSRSEFGTLWPDIAAELSSGR